MLAMSCSHIKKSFAVQPFLVLSLSMLLLVSSARAVGETLEQPLPGTATNAALHYQRAILFLYSVEPASREILGQPIWEIIHRDSSEDDIAGLDRLLIETRHAIRSALVGSEQAEANFGLDFRQYMVSSLMPHAQPMVDLGKLVALHGFERQSSGDWAQAAEAYFAVVRMGQHLTHQNTLVETIAGVEILETAYFALGQWAVACPDTALVSEAGDLLAALAEDMVAPARTLRSEASILQMRLQAMEDAFPDGPWAEMVLESLDAEFPVADRQGMREAAIAAATELGVPKEVFSDSGSFKKYISGLKLQFVELAKQSARCLSLSPPDSIRCGAAAIERFEGQLLDTERTRTLNPAKTAAYFAVHEAALRVTRTILAVSAARTGETFPSDLASVARKLGGELPRSPYDGSELKYETLEEGRGFSLTLPGATVAGVELPEIKFEHLPGE